MDVLRRKMGRVDPAAGPGAGAAWRLALARAARDEMALSLDVTDLRDERVSLAELVDAPAERSLLAVLDEPGGDGLGLCALDPALLAGMIAVLTTGKIGGKTGAGGDAPRRPTRTDAAMVAPMLDACLVGWAESLAGQDDGAWARGWRYASFLDEARPLGLLLEDTSYRVLRAGVSLMRGAATGEVLLALPASARSRRTAPVARADPDAAADAFRHAFARKIEGVTCRIEAELARCSLPLARAMALQVGEVLALGDASVARLTLRGVDGAALADARLGQMRGQRAVRLTLPELRAMRLAG